MRTYITKIVCIMMFGVLAAIGMRVGTIMAQEADWCAFKQNTVIKVLNEVVQNVGHDTITEGEMASLREKVFRLEESVAFYVNRRLCSQTDTNVFPEIILMAQEMVNHLVNKPLTEEESGKIAFLRTTIYSISQEECISRPTEDKNVIGEEPQSDVDAYSVGSEIGQSDSAKEPLLDFNIKYMYRTDGNKQFQELTEQTVMHSGDYYKIFFAPAKDCYVYIFQADLSGKIYGIFPLDNFKGTKVSLTDNFVKRGQQYFIPAQNQSFQLDQQPGTETIYFLAFRERNPELESFSQSVREAQNRGNSEEMRVAQENLQKTIRTKGLSGIEHDPAGMTMSEILDDGLSSMVLDRLKMYDDHVNEMTFKHEK
jgi:hypothetical protein